jgi:hypothetical protein
MLPVVETWDALPDEAVLRPEVMRLCAGLGVDPARLTRFTAGRGRCTGSGNRNQRTAPQRGWGYVLMSRLPGVRVYTKAPMPVMARPTIKVLISRVPS